MALAYKFNIFTGTFDLVETGGSGGGTGTWYDLSGDIDGINDTFTIPVTPGSDVVVVLGFQVQQPGVEANEYVQTGDQIVYNTPPDASLSGEPHKVFVVS